MVMNFKHNVPLKDYSTMHLGGVAKAATEAHSKDEVVEAINWAEQQKMPFLVLGEGSNVVFGDGFSGLIILNRIPGFEVLDDNDNSTTIKIGAGENWDKIVERTVDMNLEGIETLSAIPGTAGATPVQNVGAYGQEIKDTFVELEAYNIQTKKFEILKLEDCKFAYRRSIFKPIADRKYVIVNLTLKLNKTMPKRPFYPSLQRYIDQAGITDYTVKNIRDAVVAIRANILPDPKIIPNNGSFFKNPLVSKQKAAELKAQWPDMPQFDMPESQVKIPAGWLIEHAGLKGYSAHGLKTYENNALVIINESAENADDLKLFKEEIIEKVKENYGVELEQEPELI